MNQAQSEKITTATARKVLVHHFAKQPTSIQQIHGGVTNFVFQTSIGTEHFILRISNQPTKLQYFMKEQWAVRKAAIKKVPTPEILEVANDIISMPYMIMRKVQGEPATARPPDLDTYRQLGEYAAAINSIHTSDFGHNFDWSRNRLSRCHSWKHYLDVDYNAPERLHTLARSKIFPPATLKKLKTALQKLYHLRTQPSLNHGDLRLKNVILNEKGKITAIIDWEHATSNPVPYWDLAIALHDLGIDQKQAFLQGYGITAAKYQQMASHIKTLNILHYASILQTEKDRTRLAWLRQRLNHSLDLFSL